MMEQNAFKQVFTKPRYVLLTVFIFAFFYFLNVFIQNFSSLVSFYSNQGFFQAIILFWNFSKGFIETITRTSFLSLLVIGLMLGILFSLITYKTIMLKKFSGTMGFWGATGIFLGIFVPGCAACGIGLLSALGFGAAAITFLPFDGLEISLVAIGILGFSIYKISKDIKKGIVCEV